MLPSSPFYYRIFDEGRQVAEVPQCPVPKRGTPHSSPQLKLGASCGGFGEAVWVYKAAIFCLDF